MYLRCLSAAAAASKVLMVLISSGTDSIENESSPSTTPSQLRRALGIVQGSLPIIYILAIYISLPVYILQ